MVRRKRVYKTKTAVPKKRRTSLKLNKDLWLGTQSDIRKWSDENTPEDGFCPILKIKPVNWTCDHDHFDNRVRGMVCQQGNTWEGYVQKSWIKYCSKYTDLSLSDALRNLADYLENPYWIYNPLHYKGVEDMRKHLERCKKETIVLKAFNDFNIELNAEDLQEELIVSYLTTYIKHFEEGNTF